MHIYLYIIVRHKCMRMRLYILCQCLHVGGVRLEAYIAYCNVHMYSVTYHL